MRQCQNEAAVAVCVYRGYQAASESSPRSRRAEQEEGAEEEEEQGAERNATR